MYALMHHITYPSTLKGTLSLILHHLVWVKFRILTVFSVTQLHFYTSHLLIYEIGAVKNINHTDVYMFNMTITSREQTCSVHVCELHSIT